MLNYRTNHSCRGNYFMLYMDKLNYFLDLFDWSLISPFLLTVLFTRFLNSWYATWNNFAPYLLWEWVQGITLRGSGAKWDGTESGFGCWQVIGAFDMEQDQNPKRLEIWYLTNVGSQVNNMQVVVVFCFLWEAQTGFHPGPRPSSGRTLAGFFEKKFQA